MGHPIRDAVERLVLGNRRFVSGQSLHKHESPQWRDRLTIGQHPFATILGCSDARVPVELLFDQGFGDLFIIRLAGNVVVREVVASIEYAVIHLGTPLVLVLGHDNCGAVTAALSPRTERARQPDEIQSLLCTIRPALRGRVENLPEAERVAAGVVANVRLSMDALGDATALKEPLEGERLKVIGGVYELASGAVRFLDGVADSVSW